MDAFSFIDDVLTLLPSVEQIEVEFLGDSESILADFDRTMPNYRGFCAIA
jgi:hypothetical protein